MFSASGSQSHPMQVGPAGSEADRIVINVGGVRYETCKSTLMSIPGTRLANLISGGDPKHPTSEFFFDRDSRAFAPILNYYRTGKLHCPPDVCGPSFGEELAFWGISENDMEPCCWTNFRRHQDEEEALATLEPNEGPPDYSTVAGGAGRVQTCSDTCRPKLWALFDDPHSSVAAMITGIISLLFIVVSIIAFCLKTFLFNIPLNYEPSQDDRMSSPEYDYGTSQSDKSDYGNETYYDGTDRATDYSFVFFAVECVCTLWFTIEFIIRLICCPDKCKFMLNVMTIIDIMGFMFFYIALVLGEPLLANRFDVTLYVPRSIRLLRLFKMAGHVPGVRALGLSLRASVCELILLPVGLCVAILVFSILVLYAEESEDGSAFGSIFSAFWWAVITMTTVGYGDITPVTWFGKVVGSLCALTGVFAITMPVVILVTKFAKYYALAEAKQRCLVKTRRVDRHVAVASAPDWNGGRQ